MISRILLIAVLVGLQSSTSVARGEGNGNAVGPPGWAVQSLKDVGVAVWPRQTSGAIYEVSRHLNPFYLQGDFDGDCQTDIAVLVRRLKDRKMGVAVLLQRGERVEFLGAGKNVGNGGDDFRWMDIWYVYAKGAVQKGVGESTLPKLRGDALFVEKSESASGIIWFDGAAFRWYQQGD